MRTLLLVAVSLISVLAASATPISYGSTYTINLTNAPVNFNGTLPLDGTIKTIADGVTIADKIFSDGPDALWLVVTLRTSGPLAGNQSAYWEVNLQSLPLPTPTYWDNFYLNWAKDDVPVNPIFPFGGGGLGVVNTNPRDAALSPVFAGVPFSFLVDTGSLNNINVFVSPYSFVSAGGIDPATANTLTMGLHLTSVTSSVPEPATAGLGAAALLLGAMLRRRRRQA